MHRCRSAFIALLCSFTLTAALGAPKVLLVVGSDGRDAGKTRPGFEIDEFAKAWLTLRANGLEVEVASPGGGALDPDRHDPADDHIQRLLVAHFESGGVLAAACHGPAAAARRSGRTTCCASAAFESTAASKRPTVTANGWRSRPRHSPSCCCWPGPGRAR